MKADRFGIPSEQNRANAGWLSPQRAAAWRSETGSAARCSTCRHRGSDDAYGLRTVAPYCAHMDAATRDNAACPGYRLTDAARAARFADDHPALQEIADALGGAIVRKSSRSGD